MKLILALLLAGALVVGAPVPFTATMTVPAGARGSIWESGGGLVKWTPETLGNAQPGGFWTWRRFVVGPTKIIFRANPEHEQKFFIFVPEEQFCCNQNVDQVDPVE